MIKQRGQTLIETIVALFIMTMGISAALGLANFSLNASSGVRKQIIGIGLAREGIEAIKNMRDTNWLSGTLSTDCYNFEDSSLPANCYRYWLNPSADPGYVNGTGYAINAGQFYLSFDATSTAANGFWVGGGALGNPWGLNASSNPNVGLYTASGTAQSTSGFYRRVTIEFDSAVPFNRPEYQRVLVRSQVWWSDKKCPVNTANPAWPGTGRCSIQLETYLTNWKTF